jgi:hypothetical protein
MSLRSFFAVLAAVLAAVQMGCCCIRPAPWPCGRTYYGNQCGCFYWQEWFSHKPRCCDPCTTCGTFVGSTNPYVQAGPPYTRFGALYSDGSGQRAPGSIGELYSTPAGPTPAEPEGVMEDTAPTEELPGPSTSVPRGSSPQMTARGGPVDSPRYSRTLGKPPRTRLFSR